MGRTLKDLESDTVVYHFPKCKAKPLTWRVGDVEVIGEPGNDNCGFAQLGNRLISAGALPTEFFNHQLMRCNYSDFSSLVEFIQTWGFPYSPYRYSPVGFLLVERGRTRNEIKAAFESTDKLKSASYSVVISMAEAQHAIKCLQWIVCEMRKAIVGVGYDDFTIALNAATCNNLNAGFVSDSSFSVLRATPLGNYWETERLTSAICNQIVGTMADETPWRLCACDGCGVVFKARTDTSNSRGNAKYCSLTCQKRQDKRNKSASARNRADHGL
jgi:hypothetical protein